MLSDALINEFCKSTEKAQWVWICATRCGGGNPKCPLTAITCNRLDRLCNRPAVRSTEQPRSQPSNRHARVITDPPGQMLNVHHIHHAHMLKLVLKYQLHSFILTLSCSCHTQLHMLKIIRCVFTSVHTAGYKAQCTLWLLKRNDVRSAP